MQLGSSKSNLGYTLLEVLVIFVIIGIVSAIAAPSWIAFLNRQRLNTAQAEALSAIREAQASADREKRVWEASFRRMDGRIQWSVHPRGESEEANWIWNDLIREDADQIEIDESNTTLRKDNGAYNIQFKHNGWVNGQLGRITFISRGVTNTKKAPKRCLWVSTLLGAMRAESDRGCQGD